MHSKQIIKGLLLVMLPALFGCEDPIDLELDKGFEQVTVEAVLTTSDTEEQEIILRGSVPFFDKISTTPAIDNANVFVFSGTDTFDFTFDKEGRYVFQPSPTKHFEVGKTYELNLELGNERYMASSTASRTAIWDSLTYEFKEFESELSFFQEGYYVFMYARDNVGAGDCYWIKTFVNGEYVNDPLSINTAYDAGGNYGDFDGKAFSFPNSIAGVNGEEPYEKGDTIRIEIQGINSDFYFFMEEIATQMDNGGLFAAPPSNVRTNIENVDAEGRKGLGYFVIGESSARQVIID